MRAESCSLDVQLKGQMPSCSSNTTFETFASHCGFLYSSYERAREVYTMSLIASRASFDTIDVPRDDSDGRRGFSREWKRPVHSSSQIKLWNDDNNIFL